MLAAGRVCEGSWAEPVYAVVPAFSMLKVIAGAC